MLDWVVHVGVDADVKVIRVSVVMRNVYIVTDLFIRIMFFSILAGNKIQKHRTLISKVGYTFECFVVNISIYTLGLKNLQTDILFID